MGATCYKCEKADKPHCYSVCEDYKAMKADNEAKKEYLRKVKRDWHAMEHSHIDLARKKKKKRRQI